MDIRDSGQTGNAGLTGTKSEHDGEAGCLWCSTPFRPRARGGSPQRFCSPHCRREFHDCARRWATAEVDAGRLTPAELARAPKRSIYAAEARKMPRSGRDGAA